MRGDAIREFHKKQQFYRDLFIRTNEYHPTFPGTFENYFTIRLNPKALYQFYITGCQGNLNRKQRSVAGLLNTSINIQPTVNTFGLFLGDNFYPAGVTDKNDDKFRSQFSAMYSQNIFWFAALGNHDWNMQHWFNAAWQARKNPGISQLQRAMFQVDHTYLQKDKWMMPFHYYVIVTPSANLFILDSNTFYWDVLQQDWFIHRYEALNKDCDLHPKKNIIAMHHPLQTIGKRHTDAGHNDAKQYILPQYAALPRIPVNFSECSLNQLLLEKFKEIRKMDCWKIKKIPFQIDHVVSAHDHFLAHYYLTDLPETQQLVVGGGGGSLQDIHVEPELQSKPWKSEKIHGYLHLKITPEKCKFKFSKLES